MDAARPVRRGHPAAARTAAGLTWDEAAALLHVDGPTIRKHLWTAVRMTGGIPPVRAAGDAVLAEALARVLAIAATPPARAPGTACPSPEVAAALAAGALDGPLLLAEAEHAADCRTCLGALVAARRAPGAAPVRPGGETDPVAAPPPRRGVDWVVVAGAAAGLAAFVLYVVFR